jgi:hypothetical protein
MPFYSTAAAAFDSKHDTIKFTFAGETLLRIKSNHQFNTLRQKRTP